MCSVVGYIGSTPCRSFILDGLSRLEYRGYDSAGLACYVSDFQDIRCVKAVGGLQMLVDTVAADPFDGTVGIGHTRWATHGAATQSNAHPHCDDQKNVCVVHNGIIENFQTLRSQLQKAGHVFASQTDTEVIAHLFASLLVSHKTQSGAVVSLVHKLKGAYAFVAMLKNDPDCLVLVRKRSPLCIGIGDEQMFVASDSLAFADQTKKVLFLPDESFAFVHKDSIALFDFQGNALPLDVQEVDCQWVCDGKQGHEHFMLKEIYEQKRVIFDTITACERDRLWEHGCLEQSCVSSMRDITILACGTSWHAACIARYFFESLCGVRVYPELASEFRCNKIFADEHSLCIALSQSGETADTLEALRLINRMGVSSLAVTNVPSSTMVREATAFLLTQARQEVAVASTKSFTAQVALLFLLAHRIAVQKGLLQQTAVQAAEQELLLVAEVLENSIELYKRDIVTTIAPYYAQFDRLIFLGRHQSYPFAQEAALKLKEIAYSFVDCYPAGELKHGPIALVEQSVPVFLFSSMDETVYAKIVANAQEVKARNGHLVVFAFEGQEELCALADRVFVFPRVHPLLGPLAMTGVMQILVYYIARHLERPIDKPRNLAKSVTVE